MYTGTVTVVISAESSIYNTGSMPIGLNITNLNVRRGPMYINTYRCVIWHVNMMKIFKLLAN